MTKGTEMDVAEKKGAYAEAGVDIDKGNQFVREIKGIVADTHQPGVLAGIGGFSSLFAVARERYENPVLVSSTDGVGTKLAIAKLYRKHNTIGVDLVAMCANDLVVGGATPLFFLDYFATGKLDLDVAKEVVTGIAEGCKQASCSLVGGETAEMPGLYKLGDYDLAGFVVGIVDRDDIIDGSNIKPGNAIIGLASSGLHSNGYSLVRKICFKDMGLDVYLYINEFGCTLGEELLRPTKIYVKPVLKVLNKYKHSVNGMIHNTGGGFYDNVPRVLPGGLKAVIDTRKWRRHPIFDFLMNNGNVPIEEMHRTFNMGIGLMMVVEKSWVKEILAVLTELGETPFVIGEIMGKSGGDEDVELIF